MGTLFKIYNISLGMFQVIQQCFPIEYILYFKILSRGYIISLETFQGYILYHEVSFNYSKSNTLAFDAAAASTADLKFKFVSLPEVVVSPSCRPTKSSSNRLASSATLALRSVMMSRSSCFRVYDILIRLV